MRLLRPLLIVSVVAASSATASSEANAQPSPQLEEAKQLFRRGNELRRAGDCEQALVYFAKSRAVVPSVPNVLNAAVCLKELGRYDEALEHYEDLLVDHKDELTAAERSELEPEMKQLRAKLGSLQVITNVEAGQLVVDGRHRAALPLVAPLRLLPGTHDVRLVKDGYEPHTAEVEVRVGEVTRLEGKLQPLAVAGRLRLAGAGLDGAVVIVDGAEVGKMPWEGVLAPGNHIVSAVRGDVGSAPVEAVVVKGQVALVELEARPLGPELEVHTDPPSAELYIGGVAVGARRFRGRLPIGKHVFEAREEGYLDRQQAVEVTSLGPGKVSVALEIDEEHARWGVEPGSVLIDLLGGLALAPTLSSGAEKSCGEAFTCGDNPLALGPIIGASAGYELSFGLSLEVAGGWFRLAKTTQRDTQVEGRLVRPGQDATLSTVSFSLTDQIALSGGFVGAGVGYRRELVGPLELRLRLLAGAAFVDTRDVITGTASTETTSSGTSRAAAEVAGAGQSSSSANVLLMPGVHLGLRFDGFGVALGLSLPMLLLDGPAHEQGALSAGGGCDPDIGTVGCIQGQPITTAEQSHGRWIAPTPSLRFGYAFQL